ncbi:DNA polymerase III subunit delta' [Gammaproteobacteria bacterium 45_16_T64]|nr:DNA polymerase III subunit delta' [Gammaproteobacteria bacterium 45_16_T64]
MLAEILQIVVPLPWQAEHWGQLHERREQKALPHALLLRGVGGTGKGQFALAFSQYLLCQSPVGRVACGKCKSCLLMKAGSHPDLKIVEPEEKGKAIKIDQIREVVELSGKSAQFGGYRVIVIAPTESMNVNASNALLKCLEEPGENTVMLLITHQVSGVMATIRSRCQSLDFPLPKTDHAIHWLSSVISDPERANLLISVAGGAPLRALELEQREWLKDRQDILRAWIGVLKGQVDPIVVAEQWAKYPLSDLFTWLQAWQIDLGKVVAGGDSAVLNQDLLPHFKEMSRICSPNKVFDFYNYLLELGRMAASSSNPNPQLLLEQLLIRWSETG